jgi:hypothetical protein
MLEGLQLSSRQIAIVNLLEKLNQKLVPIYLGAMETLRSKPADFMALAARSLANREDLSPPSGTEGSGFCLRIPSDGCR